MLNNRHRKQSRKRTLPKTGTNLIPHTTYKGWMIYYQSPRMKACAHRWSEEHLTLAEFWKTKKGEWLLARGLWSHTDDPRNWIPRLQEFKERILRDAEKGQEYLE
jgi:hypothetical protein